MTKDMPLLLGGYLDVFKSKVIKSIKEGCLMPIVRMV
jgi:hypothetical protein